jgi:hypothetical protein
MTLQEGHTLVPRTQFTDALHQQHTRLVHYFHGVRVWGSEAVIHLEQRPGAKPRRLPDPAPAPDLVLAEEAPDGHTQLRPLPIHLDLEATVDAAQAGRIIQESLGAAGGKAVIERSEKVIFPVYRTLLAPARPGRPANAEDAVRELEGHRLAWQLRTRIQGGDGSERHWDYLVDAHDGAVIQRIPADFSNRLAEARARTSWSASSTLPLDTERLGEGGYLLVDPTRGKGGMFDGNAVLNGFGLSDDQLAMPFSHLQTVWGSGSPGLGQHPQDADLRTNAAEAAYGLRCAWDYFLNIHGRLGWDGHNTAMAVKLVNSFADLAQYDNDQEIQIGWADRDLPHNTVFILGHEFTHAVTRATADLAYAGESGGLNEATSDIFGKMIEAYAQRHHLRGPAIGAPDSWEFRQRLAGNGESRLIRSMKHPSAVPDVPDAWTPGLGDLDPHDASGPMNRAFYFLAQGASRSAARRDEHSALLPGGMWGLGTDRAARIWYRALVTYLKPTSTYLDARAAAMRAAVDLYGADPAREVAKAFAAIGVGRPGPAPVPGAARAQVTSTLEGGTWTLAATGSGFDLAVFRVDDVPEARILRPPYTLTLDTRYRLANGPHAWEVRLLTRGSPEVHVWTGEVLVHNPVQQLLADPGLEGVDARSWLGLDAPGVRSDAWEEPAPHGGLCCARFARTDGQERDPALVQRLAFPAGRKEAILRFWAWTRASREQPEQDLLTFEIRAPAAGDQPVQVLAAPVSLSGRDAWNDWVEYEVRIPALADLPEDRKVALAIQSRLVHDDAAFFLDDVRLIAAAEPPVRVVPSVRKATVTAGATLDLSAEVRGSADARLLWAVRGGDGGRVDAQGRYTAPERPGIAHVLATAEADPGARAEISLQVVPREERKGD